MIDILCITVVILFILLIILGIGCKRLEERVEEVECTLRRLQREITTERKEQKEREVADTMYKRLEELKNLAHIDKIRL